MAILEELKRRGVIQTAALYVAVAWGGTEIFAFLIEALLGENTASAFGKYFAILFIAGFPVAMYLSWSRDLGLQARRFISAGALAVFFVAILVWLVPAKYEAPELPSLAPDGIKALAVLPLDNLSAEPDQGFFAAGMTEALIAELSRLGVFKVISRTSVMQYQGTTKTIPEIAAELDVDAVVEGSVFRSGNQVRITAQVIEAATDHHIWADSFEGNMEDVLALQNKAAKSIVRGIGATFENQGSPERMSRRVDPEAYDAFLQVQLMSLESRDNPEPVIEAAERAIRLDPTFAPAYALLSDLYGYLALTTNLTQGDAYLQAHQLARQAIELDPEQADSRYAMARVLFQFEWDWEAAEAEFLHGVRLNPNNSNGLATYGAFRVLIHGDCEGGLALLDSARDIDPFNPGIHFDLGVYNFQCRHWEESIRHLERTNELVPDFYWPRMIIAWNNLLAGSTELAVQQCDRVVEEAGSGFDFRLLGSCAWVYATAGQASKATVMMEKLSNPPAGIRVDPLTHSYVCLVFDDTTCALDYLEKAIRQRSSEMIFLRTMPALDPIRDEPRFQAVMKQMNYPE
jgi:adenylate cyclase